MDRPADMPRKKSQEADLRHGYGKTFWSCFGGSFVAHLAVVALFPHFQADAYDKSEPVIIQIEDIPETRQERRPPPPPRPVVPIASDSDDIPEDATIMETDLDFGLDDLAPPPPLEELYQVEMEEEEEEIVEEIPTFKIRFIVQIGVWEGDVNEETKKKIDAIDGAEKIHDKGILYKYVKSVSNASKGCITDE